MIYRRRKNVLTYFVRPFLLMLLFTGIFGIVWLRSRVIAMEYRIGEIEKLRAEALRERKLFEADMAALLSISRTEEGELVFPDRRNVFYVKRDRGDIPYSASYGRD